MGMYGRVVNFLRAPAKSFTKKKIKKKEMIIICSIEAAAAAKEACFES